MAISGSNSIGFDYTQLNVGGGSTSGSASQAGETGGMSTPFALQLAQFQSSQLSELIGSADAGAVLPGGVAGVSSGSDPLSMLDMIGQAKGLTAGGLNPALRDPQAGYDMMTKINNLDVSFKAQYAELGQMGNAMSAMGQDGQSLGAISTGSDSAGIKTQLQTFVGQYNDWVKSFDGDMQSGGLLAGTQAAQVARHELSASVQSLFNGADQGVSGLGDIGLTIDQVSGLASLDGNQLDQMLNKNKAGVVAAIDQFSAGFSKAAQTITGSDNFIQNQLGNLGNAISYLSKNEQSLQAEFGTGAAANPTGAVAQALALYNQTSQG